MTTTRSTALLPAAKTAWSGAVVPAHTVAARAAIAPKQNLMRFADAEQWLAVGVLLAWLPVAAASAAGRLPRIGRLRRGNLIGSGTAVGLFLAQAMVVDAVADPEGISTADPPILQWMIDHRSPLATAAFQTITTVGSTAAMAVLAAVAALVLTVRGRHRDALVVFVAAVGASLLIDGLKNFYRRPRPPELTRLEPEANCSLPSGHALGSTVVLGILAAVLFVAVGRHLVVRVTIWRAPPSRWPRSV